MDIPTCCNCTTIHTGTYDQEFMVICDESIETPTTTPATPTEIYTTTSTAIPLVATTSTESLSTQTPVETTTAVYLTTTESLSPSPSSSLSYTTSTTPASTPQTTTILNQSKDQSKNLSYTNESSSYIENISTDPPAIYNTIIQQESPTNTAILITSISISIVALIGCIGLTIWSYRKHHETKHQKMVRPSEVNLELSPTAKQPMLKGSKDDIDIENQLKMNKLKMNKIRQQQGPHTDRPMMQKRPSQIKKMSLADWRKLQAELKQKSKPQVNRKLKPPKNQFKPPAPSVNQPKMVVPQMKTVVNKQSTVNKMIKKFNKK